MTAEDTVDAFIAAIERNDVEGAIALLSDDISYENVPLDPVVGPEAVAAVLHMFLDQADAVDWQIRRQFSDGPTVFNERLDRFRMGDGWLELPVAGVFHVTPAGKIDLWRDYFDMATYQRQLEALTP